MRKPKKEKPSRSSSHARRPVESYFSYRRRAELGRHLRLREWQLPIKKDAALLIEKGILWPLDEWLDYLDDVELEPSKRPSAKIYKFPRKRKKGKNGSAPR